MGGYKSELLELLILALQLGGALRDPHFQFSYGAPCALLALAKLCLGFLALGDVPSRPGDQLDLAVRPDDRREDVLVNAENPGERRLEGHFPLDRALRLDHLRDLAHVHVVVPLLVAELAAGLADHVRQSSCPRPPAAAGSHRGTAPADRRGRRSPAWWRRRRRRAGPAARSAPPPDAGLLRPACAR